MGMESTNVDGAAAATTSLRKFFAGFGLTGFKLNAQIAEVEFSFNEVDAEAAWELYIELLTRVTTQMLDVDYGLEEAALASVHSLFPITREVLRRKGRKTTGTAKIAIIVLNQMIRPFTTKWHRRETNFTNPDTRIAFREDLAELQPKLAHYTAALAEIAGVEDWSEMEIEQP